MSALPMKHPKIIPAATLIAAVRRQDPDVQVILNGKTYAVHICGLPECQVHAWRSISSRKHGGQYRFYCCEEHRLTQERRLANARQKRWKQRTRKASIS